MTTINERLQKIPQCIISGVIRLQKKRRAIWQRSLTKHPDAKFTDSFITIDGL